MMVDPSFWKGKKVLVTGHTGFKGSWLSIWLLEMGADVIGYALDPLTDKDNFVLSKLSDKMTDIRGDICDSDKLSTVVKEYKPEIIFHLAAQPLVRLSYKYPKLTYETNVLGSLNVLECFRESNTAKACIMITTDKCYDNKEQIWGYREDDKLGGYDMYSSSKACAELLIGSYRNSFLNPKNYSTHGKAIASARAGNVIGGGDWSQDRLIPDCIQALEDSKDIIIRNPSAVRPWQLVLEPLAGYMTLCQQLYNNPVIYADAWNFGPKNDEIYKVIDVVKILINYMGKGRIQVLSDNEAMHESTLLTLDTTKSRVILDHKSKLNIEETIRLTAEWYKYYTANDVYNICSEQIKEYIEKEIAI